MKTLGDTTAWKAFLLFFLLYGTTVSIAKAGDGGDEMANSCETATFLEDYEQDFTFLVDQESYYIEFLADNDSLIISVLQGEMSEQNVKIDRLELYFIEDCENLILLDSLSANLQDYANYLSYTNYQLEGNYLLHLKRAGDFEEEMPFKIKIDHPQLVASCPAGIPNCYEMVKNGDFSDWLVSAPNIQNAFEYNEVCHWKAAAPNPQLIYRNGSHFNNGPLLSNPYAGLYSTVYNNGFGPYTEGIHTGVNVSANKEYSFRFKLQSSPLTNYGNPDSVRVWLIKESELNNLHTPKEKYLSMINNNRQQVGVVTKNQINSTFTEYTFCVRADDNYDRLLIFAHTPTLPPSSPNHRFVHVDDVSLVNISDLDAGDDKTITYCGGNDVVIGPDCLIPFANYNWSPGTGLSIPNFPYPTVDPLNNAGTYTLWIDVPGTSCGGADQVTVSSDYDVLPDGEDVSWGYNNLPSIDQNISTGDYESNGKTFVIEGEFEVNHNWTLNSCKLWMEEGAKIIVSNGAKLHFNGQPWVSFIKTCQGRWDGIYVDSGAVVQINDLDTFKNSNAGIQLANGAGIIMHDVDFYQNAKGVTYNGNGTTTPNIFDVDWNYFRCDEPLSNGSGGYYYPQHAIELNNLYSSNASRPKLSSNRIFGSAGGVKVVKGDVVVEYNVFDGFYDNSGGINYPGDPTYNQTAIKLQGRTNINDTLPKFLIYKNTFKTIKQAISTSNQMELVVDYNYMNASPGITGWQTFPAIPGCTFLSSSNNNLNGGSGDVKIEIVRNRLIDVGQGILFYNTNTTNSRGIEMFNNTIIGQANYGSIGVLVDNSNLATSYVYTDLRSNKISRINKGVHIINASIYLWQSEIKNIFEYDPPLNYCSDPFQPCPCFNPPCDLPNVPGFAVKISGSVATIVDTKIQNQFTGIPNFNIEGVVFENSNGFEMTCDSILNMGQGMRFSGVNASGYRPDASFHSISLIDNFNDFILQNYGEIGIVGDSVLYSNDTIYTVYGNSIFWEKSNPNYGFHIACVKNTDGTKSDLFLGQTSYNPSRFFVDTSSTLLSMTSINTSYTPGPCSPFPSSNSKTNKKNQLANNQLKSLKINNEWHDRLMARSKTIPNANRVKFEQQLGYFNYIKDTSIHSIPKFQHYYDSIALTSLGQLVSAQKMMQNDALVKNISASNPLDRNLKFTIRMSMKAKKHNGLNNQEISRLEVLANECPYESGYAVYQARNILGQLGFYGFINECENVQMDSSQFHSRRKKVLAPSDEHRNIKLYPNPASEIIVLEWQIEGENASICFYDMLGKEVKCNQLNNEVNKQLLDVSALTNGVFMYQLKRNGTIVKTGKIVIN